MLTGNSATWKRAITLAAFAWLVAFALPFGPQIGIAAAGPAAAGTIYADPDGFFSLSYPPKWTAKRAGSEMQFQADKSGNTGVAVSLQIKAVSVESALDEIVALLKERQDGYSQVGRQLTEAGGYPAARVDYTYRLKQVAYQGFVLVAVRNRIGFVLIGWTPEKGAAGLKNTFQSIIDSFTINTFREAPDYDDWLSHTSAHFTFRYLPKTYVASDIKRIAQDHERVYADIVKTLKLSYADPITVFLYPSEESLYRATARNAGHAITEAGEVHALWVSKSNHQSLGHEMTHVITAQAIGEPSEALLGEGLAVCLDHSGNDPHATAAELLASGDLIPLSQMLGDAWFEHDAAVAYPESGSLACYLLEKQGAQRLKRAFVASSFKTALKDVYKTSLAALERAWHADLEARR
jgi:hypothetical protein